MPSNFCEPHVFFLLCVLVSRHASKSDATETLDLRADGPLQVTARNTSLNPVWNGGRHSRTTWARGQAPVGCRELRSVRYISDGQCTSVTPVKELVCAGDCLPFHKLPNRISSGAGARLWGRSRELEWRCVTDRSRSQRVRLRCRDGSDRAYQITAVTSCKCERNREVRRTGTKLKTHGGRERHPRNTGDLEKKEITYGL